MGLIVNTLSWESSSQTPSDVLDKIRQRFLTDASKFDGQKELFIKTVPDIDATGGCSECDLAMKGLETLCIRKQ